MSSGTSETGRATRGGRLARTVFAGLSAAAVTAVFLAGPAALPAAADPPLTVAEAKAQIEQLQTDAAAIDQDYAGVQQQISQSKANLQQKQADVAAQATKVATMKKQVGQVALAQFQNRNVDTAAQLFLNSDTEGFLSQISTVEKVSENQNSVLQEYQQEQADLADLQHSTQTDLATLEAKQQELQSLRSASDKKIADSKAILARLTTQEQQQIADQARQQADAAAAAVNADPTTTGSTTTDPTTTGSTTDATGRAAKAMAFAKAQLGKPYRFGATGPGAYDCSGLTLAAWRAAGVSLSRTSESQFHDGRAISKAELQPGDLVFFYSSTSPSHVALYAGNGMVLHAPHPGASVQYIKMSYMPFSGARRVG